MALAYRVRFVMEMNAREATHLLELRSSPQGHPAYRRVAQEMHRLIAEQAKTGHLDAIICGRGFIKGRGVILAVLDGTKVLSWLIPHLQHASPPSGAATGRL